MIFNQYLQQVAVLLLVVFLTINSFNVKGQEINSFIGEIRYHVTVEPLINEDGQANLREFDACLLLANDSVRIQIKEDKLRSSDYGGFSGDLVEALYIGLKDDFSIFHDTRNIKKTIYKGKKGYSSNNRKKEWFQNLKPDGIDSTILSLPTCKYTSVFKDGLKKEFWYYQVPLKTENGDGLVHIDFGIALLHIDYIGDCKITYIAINIENKEINDDVFMLPKQYSVEEFFPPRL